jgi:hypothetical protein
MVLRLHEQLLLCGLELNLPDIRVDAAGVMVLHYRPTDGHTRTVADVIFDKVHGIPATQQDD